MPSVKHLILDDSPAGKLYVKPTNTEFGRGAWGVAGKYSVGDLKYLLADSDIVDKAEALTMMAARYHEWFANQYPDMPTCYIGVLNHDGKVVDTTKLMDDGEKSNIIVMKLAHVPESFSNGDLNAYRKAMVSGELQCAVADVESIFRAGLPLGSSVFERIFETFAPLGLADNYKKLATYEETAAGLEQLRGLAKQLAIASATPLTEDENKGLVTLNTVARLAAKKILPSLESLLSRIGVDTIPNPGFVLKDIIYDTTTKFEEAGDRVIDAREAQKLGGLNEKGYDIWTTDMFPKSARGQVRFSNARKVLNMDGKEECVAYQGMPVFTDFRNTVDENRLMIIIEIGGVKWAIPANKEIQRALFRREGVYAAIGEAKALAMRKGNLDAWKSYMPEILKQRNIDLKAVSEHSCNLMGYAIGEVANRLLERKVFDAKPIDTWVNEFLPYASKIELQK